MNSFSEGRPSEMFFENQNPLITAREFCSQFGYSIKTIYEWKYRPKRNKVPDGLVVKFRGKLFIRRDILGSLIASNSFPLRKEERSDYA
jgi:hypothetical protein